MILIKSYNLGSEAACSSHSVEVGIRILRHVVVEHDVDALNIHSSAKEIRSHQDALKLSKWDIKQTAKSKIPVILGRFIR